MVCADQMSHHHTHMYACMSHHHTHMSKVFRVVCAGTNVYIYIYIVHFTTDDRLLHVYRGRRCLNSHLAVHCFRFVFNRYYGMSTEDATPIALFFIFFFRSLYEFFLEFFFALFFIDTTECLQKMQMLGCESSGLEEGV